MRIRAATLQSTLLFLLIVSPLAQAEEITTDITQQAPEISDIKRPWNGQSKDEVNQQYGPPQEMTESVGNPPISRWVYQNYSVYFEYNTVLHTVLHHRSNL